MTTKKTSKKSTASNELNVALHRIEILEAELEAKNSKQSDRIATYFVKKDASERTVNSLSETAKHFEVNERETMRKLCEAHNCEQFKVRDFNRIIAELVAKNL